MQFVRIVGGIVDNVIVLDHEPVFEPAEQALWSQVPDTPAVLYGWVKNSDGSVTAPPVPPSPPVDLAAYVRAKSYDIRVAGTTINGVQVVTDDAAIAMINGMNSLAQQDSTQTFAFDTGGTPITLTAAQAIALATAVGKWVQSTFTQRAAILAKVADGTLKTTADVDGAFAS